MNFLLDTFDDFVDDLLSSDVNLLKGELDFLLMQDLFNSTDLYCSFDDVYQEGYKIMKSKKNNKFSIKLRVFELNFIYLPFINFISLMISIIKTTIHISAK